MSDADKVAHDLVALVNLDAPNSCFVQVMEKRCLRPPSRIACTVPTEPDLVKVIDITANADNQVKELLQKLTLSEDA